jgi:hypothetical protein
VAVRRKEAMSFAIATEPDLIRVTFSGILTEDDLRGIATAAADIERDVSPVPHRITDMTGVTELQISYPDVQALADNRRAFAFPNPFKSAIVIRGPAQLGMARMFQTLNDNPQITIEIFSDASEALTWLRR